MHNASTALCNHPSHTTYSPPPCLLLPAAEPARSNANRHPRNPRSPTSQQIDKPTSWQADKLASRQVGNPRTPARARLHPVFAPPAAPHRPPPAEPRTLSSLTRRVNQKPTTSSSSCLHPPPHHAPAALARQQQSTNHQEPGGGAAPPPPIAAKPSTLQHRRPLQRPPRNPHPVFSYPPGKPCPCTHSTCER